MADRLFEKCVVAGNKVDIKRVSKKRGEKGPIVKTYHSQVYNVISEDRIEITMPMENGKIVMLLTGVEYDLDFFSFNGIFHCKAKVVSKGKRDNAFLLEMELTTNIHKDQRREFYRFNCLLELKLKVMTEEEVKQFEKSDLLLELSEEEWQEQEKQFKKGVIVDISGGGLRFSSGDRYAANSTILCKYRMEDKPDAKEYEVLGKILDVKPSKNRADIFEYRVKFVNIYDEAREEIIRFIFEAERKNRRKMTPD